MKKISVGLAVVLGLFALSCGKDEGANIDRENDPSVFPEKPTDISQLPLDQALKAKYSKLVFKCDYRLVTVRPSLIGALTQSVVEKQFHIWDILNDFNKTAQLELNYIFEDVRTKVIWDFQVDIVKKANPKSEGASQRPLYQVNDAVVLKGSSTTYLVELDEKGVELGSSEIQLNDRVYYDRIPNQVSNSEHKFTDNSKNSTSFNLECIIDAKVNPGFESDFKVVRN